jgi:hypothetical protein
MPLLKIARATFEDTMKKIFVGNFNDGSQLADGQTRKTSQLIYTDIVEGLAGKIMGVAPKEPKYKVGQVVKYDMYPPQKDGCGEGEIKAYKNGHYIINDRPVNLFEIKKDTMRTFFNNCVLAIKVFFLICFWLAPTTLTIFVLQHFIIKFW